MSEPRAYYPQSYTAGTRTFSASGAGATNHIDLGVNRLSKYFQITNDGSSAAILLVRFDSANTYSAGSTQTYKVKSNETFDANIEARKVSIKASAGTASGRFLITYDN